MQNDLGITVEKKDLGYDPRYPGENIKLPPVILASLGNDPTKKTVRKLHIIDRIRTPEFVGRSGSWFHIIHLKSLFLTGAN